MWAWWQFPSFRTCSRHSFIADEFDKVVDGRRDPLARRGGFVAFVDSDAYVGSVVSGFGVGSAGRLVLLVFLHSMTIGGRGCL